MSLKPIEVFTPNDYPKHSYVQREGDDLERKLHDALDTPNVVISLSGPSKSGKTVLVERVLGPARLIPISGAEIRTADDLWNRVLDWMEVPGSVTTTETAGTTRTTTAEVSGKGGVPLLAEVAGKGQLSSSAASTKSTANTVARRGLVDVEREIAGSDFCIFIDDFHYIARDVQEEVARQLRAASGRGIRICVASVPHRSDDVVRSNPELRGRTAHIDTAYWKPAELRRIADTGFAKLGVVLPSEKIDRLALEACGSPQLMQLICLQLCFRLNIRTMNLDPTRLELGDEVVADILEQASTRSDYSSLVRQMHQGPKTRGTERKVHELRDGTHGDVYRAVLLAICKDPPMMDLSYRALIDRVNGVCVGDPPASSSVTTACKFISQFARTMYPAQRVLEWDDTSETLSFVDPYLLFYLRNSQHLRRLAEAGT